VLLSWLCTEALLATLPSIQYTIPNNRVTQSIVSRSLFTSLICSSPSRDCPSRAQLARMATLSMHGGHGRACRTTGAHHGRFPAWRSQSPRRPSSPCLCSSCQCLCTLSVVAHSSYGIHDHPHQQDRRGWSEQSARGQQPRTLSQPSRLAVPKVSVQRPGLGPVQRAQDTLHSQSLPMSGVLRRGQLQRGQSTSFATEAVCARH
jgi:hypothetical protein